MGVGEITVGCHKRQTPPHLAGRTKANCPTALILLAEWECEPEFWVSLRCDGCGI